MRAMQEKWSGQPARRASSAQVQHWSMTACMYSTRASHSKYNPLRIERQRRGASEHLSMHDRASPKLGASSCFQKIEHPVNGGAARTCCKDAYKST